MKKNGLQLGFLASGGGSSARRIVEAIRAGELEADARVLVSNRRDAPALAWAAQRDVPTACIPTAADAAAADARLTETLNAHGVGLLILSGYLRKLGPRTLAAYAGRILNIHPGALPRFGGEGMYGRRVHEAVIASGERETAIVIHLVDGEYDHGPELARQDVGVSPEDNAETLEAKIKALEPDFFLHVLGRIAAGSIRLPGINSPD